MRAACGSGAAAAEAARSGTLPPAHHCPAVLTLQMMLGWGILMAILTPTVVWDKVQEYGISATLALIVFGYYCQPASGGNVFVFLASTFIVCLGGALAFIPTYLAIAANGGTWAGYAAAKGATLVGVCAVLAGLFAVPFTRLDLTGALLQMNSMLFALRFFPIYWVSASGLMVAGVADQDALPGLASCRSCPTETQRPAPGPPTPPAQMMTPEGLVAVPVPPNSSAYYTILAVASPLALAIALTFLVLPTPAGRQVGTAGEAAALTMAHRGSQRSRGGI